MELEKKRSFLQAKTIFEKEDFEINFSFIIFLLLEKVWKVCSLLP